MSSTQEFEQAAAAERKAAQGLDLRGQVVALSVALVFYVLYLALDHTAGVRGVQVVVGHSGISLMERIFAYGTTAGMVCTALTLATRHTYAGWIAWMLSGFSFFVALWAVWALGTEGGAGVGFYCAVIADLMALVAFSRVAMRKSPEQLAAQARMRAAAGRLDAVALAQAESSADHGHAPHLLLVDDRRAQAAARYRRQQDS